MPEEEKQEQKEEDKVVLTTDMHCNACKNKVNKVLKNFPGVEKVDLDARERKVTVKGKVDAKKVFEAVKQKCGKRTVLVYPQLSKEEEKKKEEEKEKEKAKEEPPPDVTVELRVKMHCGACAKEIKKRLLKVNGVTEVHEDLASDKVVVKGKGLDAEKLCEKVRKCGKHCQVIPPPPPKEEKKEEEKKEEEKKAEGEEKKDEKKEEKKEESAGDIKVEVKRYEYPPYRTIHEYMYPPQLFSDENPNACRIM
eukprot:c15333_g1_i1 orf=1065-1817(+)